MTYANTPRPPDGSGSDRVVHMPPARTGLLVAAGVLLLIPIVALMWVSSYAKETPRLGGIPFFFWYQFAWVFVTSALTYTAHRLVLAARGLGTDGAPRDVPGRPGDDTTDPGYRP